MRKSVRLAKSNRDLRNEGLAAPASAPPRTPHRPKNGAELKELVRSIEEKWHLGLNISDEAQSPAQNRTTAGKAVATIKELFWTDMPALDEAVDCFHKSASGFRQEARLDLLIGMLRSRRSTRSPLSRPAAPIGARNDLRKSLPCKCISEALTRGNVFRGIQLLGAIWPISTRLCT